jgi:hypothetical protein
MLKSCGWTKEKNSTAKLTKLGYQRAVIIDIYQIFAKQKEEKYEIARVELLEEGENVATYF